MIKNTLAVIGAFVLILTLLGMFNIGNFVMMYDMNPIVCVKGV